MTRLVYALGMRVNIPYVCVCVCVFVCLCVCVCVCVCVCIGVMRPGETDVRYFTFKRAPLVPGVYIECVLNRMCSQFSM